MWRLVFFLALLSSSGCYSQRVLDDEIRVRAKAFVETVGDTVPGELRVAVLPVEFPSRWAKKRLNACFEKSPSKADLNAILSAAIQAEGYKASDPLSVRLEWDRRMTRVGAEITPVALVTLMRAVNATHALRTTVSRGSDKNKLLVRVDLLAAETGDAVVFEPWEFNWREFSVWHTVLLVTGVSVAGLAFWGALVLWITSTKL